MDINIQDIHYKKYLKYKTKYLELKQSGGSDSVRDKCFSYNGITLPQKEIKKINSEYFSDFIVIYELLIKILDSLNINNTFKNWFSNLFSTTKIISIACVFELIIIDLRQSNIDYRSFNNFIEKKLYDTDEDDYSVDHINHYKNVLKRYKDKISELETKINTNIEYIINIHKDKLIKLEKIINNKIESFNENDLKILFPNSDFKNKGLDSLQYIIKSYFYKIIDGLECSHPIFRKPKRKY